MENPFLDDSSLQETTRESKKADHLSARFPAVYRVPKSLPKRLREWLQSKIAHILGRPDPNRSIPVTVLTGFLGAGKTTLVVNLMKELLSEYRVAWLKNEFGGTAVDSELAAHSGVAAVKEMLQGCICHVLIGQLGTALEELLAANPDRIIIETSGSAAPAPIVWETRKHPRLIVDGVVTVIDAVNFPGYKDKSYTAKLQAQYTDLILINKHEKVSEKVLDQVLDDVYELNPNTPKIKTDGGRVDPAIIFGLNSKLFETEESVREEESHIEAGHQHDEVSLIEATFEKKFLRKELERVLRKFPKERFYRIKGVLFVDGKPSVLNWAFGSFQIIPLRRKQKLSRIVFMGEGINSFKSDIATIFSISEESIVYRPAEHEHGRHEHSL